MFCIFKSFLKKRLKNSFAAVAIMVFEVDEHNLVDKMISKDINTT